MLELTQTNNKIIEIIEVIEIIGINSIEHDAELLTIKNKIHGMEIIIFVLSVAVVLSFISFLLIK
jgi:hypothetical protein